MANEIKQVFFSPSDVDRGDMMYVITTDGRMLHGEWEYDQEALVYRWAWQTLPALPEATSAEQS